MKEVFEKDVLVGDIVVTIVPRNKLAVAIVREVKKKEVIAKRIDNDKEVIIKKDNKLMVIHENNFYGEYLEKIRSFRAEVM